MGFLLALWFYSSNSCEFVSVCVVAITIGDKQVTSAQIKEHRGAVLDLIEMYLRGEFQCNSMQFRQHVSHSLSSGVFCECICKHT